MKKGIWLGLMAVGLAGAATASEVRFVDEFDLSGSTCGLGLRTLPRQSVGGHPLTVGGKVYERGFGSHSEGAAGFRTDGRIEAFDALVGVDDDATAAKRSDRQAKLLFKVWADGRIVWTSPVMQEGMRPVPVHVDLKGVREVVLETSSSAPWLAFEACNGDWLDARFICADGTKIEAITDPAETVQLGILTPPEKPEPQINGADIWGVHPGHPVIFRIATSGVRPMKFTAKGLPDGVTLDTAKGILGGIAPQKSGNYDIEVTAENAKGRVVRTIRLAVGDTIALTPPMGWNSWNIWGTKFNGEHAKAAARALDESGLGDHGWSYVNLDDFWEMNNSPQNTDRPELRGPARDAEGRILSNPSFPDMKGLTDYIHSFGFKAGLYSSPGPTTCGGCEGSYGHELQDATRWAEWGFDYVKYDWCSYDEVIKDERGGKSWYDGTWRDERGASKERPYRLMKDCLLKQNRDILYSFCQYGMGHAEEWARDAGANCWRSWEDLKDTWPWMEKALEGSVGAANLHKFNGPGCWADPDMMLVGLQRSFGSTHPTYLTPNEQYTHVSLWCMIGSPLLIGTDLTKLDAFTKNLLVNDEVIAVSQDRLGKTARRIRHTDAESVWVRPLVGGDVAVALVNRYPFAREIKVSFEELELSGERWVKDLWRQKCEGRHSGEYFALVPPHATKLVKMRPLDCKRCPEEPANAQKRVVEGGIEKFTAGRTPEEAKASGEAAYERPVSDEVIYVDETMTLADLNRRELNPGTKVLFKRGGVWRGQIVAQSGKPGHPIMYGAYGEGPKPCIQPSYDASNATRWKNTGVWVWEFEVGAENDIGNVIFDGGGKGCAVKRQALARLSDQLNYCYEKETRTVVMLSADNPATRFKSIELCEKIHCVDETWAHDVVYEGLHFRYSAAHGIGGSNTKRITIRNCDISWIGGGYLYYDKKDNGVRYGNGIEFWSAAEGHLVESNRVWECWDAGLTNQSSEDNVLQKDIVWRGNEVWNCEYSFEYWQQGVNARTENVRFENNICRDAGKGWGHRQRWNPNAAHLMFYDTTAETKGFVVRNNVFSRSEDCLFRLFNDWRRNLTLAGNKWVAEKEPICRYHGRPTRDLIYKYPDRLDQMHDDNLTEIQSQGLGARIFKADGLDAFLKFMEAK